MPVASHPGFTLWRRGPRRPRRLPQIEGAAADVLAWFHDGGPAPSAAPEWRNWQTRGTQNAVVLDRVGSNPTSGTAEPHRARGGASPSRAECAGAGGHTLPADCEEG